MTLNQILQNISEDYNLMSVGVVASAKTMLKMEIDEDDMREMMIELVSSHKNHLEKIIKTLNETQKEK